MLAELTQTVLRVEQNQLEMGQSLQSLDERVRVLSAQQATLIELLTPEQKTKKGGPGLDELLAEMIVRLDQQNYLLKDVSDTVSRAVTALPLSIVKAMADGVPALGRAGSCQAPGRLPGRHGMISFRKISAASKGKLIRAYLSEGTALDDAGRRLANYYAGRDPRASWRPDMAPTVAQALGINPSLAPGDKALERLFEARRGDTGEAWTANKRSISAYDLTASPDKSVTLAIEFARDDAEKAALILAVWRANMEWKLYEWPLASQLRGCSL